ncbi:MAG TPA: clan AA aspartic protease [Thermoanaerobaculia bacterium]|nr:clan AA aspartic protease [Thermoanaerobaculia bacterium]
MMTGTVSFHEATFRLVVCGPSGEEREVEAVVDTGFNGSLTLPPYLVAELGLPFRTKTTALLGDGSQVLFNVHDGIVLWNGRPRRVAVDVADTEPLFGMRLMEGHELTIEVIEGGSVSITELFRS